MYFSNTIPVIIVCAMYVICIRCQLGREQAPALVFKNGDNKPLLNSGIVTADTDFEKDDETLPEDHYSFVALIDVVFTNGEKKSCTGTIIHDYVVITAAHCFNIGYESDNVQPELTASFVVIGTKKMFDTGYEQYLPIERVILNPKYKGWTADLALVYTFAGMMSDKPGRIIPLATEKTITPVDSDVTVFSWGRFKETEMTPTEKVDSFSNEEAVKPVKFEKMKERFGHKRKKKRKHRYKGKKRNDIQITRARGRTWATTSKFLSSIEENNNNLFGIASNINDIRISEIWRLPQFKYNQQTYENLSEFDSEIDEISWEKKTENLDKMYERSVVNEKRKKEKDRRQINKVMSYYRNGWRRQMGDKENKLTVEVFGFVNMHSCQKIVEKAMPSLYGIKNPLESVCYSSEERYITEEDSGAPAIRHGRLVAVTVGGADFDGEHVAVGIKVTCFCSWIAENLPKSSARQQCCKNCCDFKVDDVESKELSFRHTKKKRKS